MTMNEESEYIATGFKEDCEVLFERYLKKNSMKIQDFFDIWNEQCFPMIFAGRESFEEMVEFVEEALLIAKSFMFPPNDMKIRAAGIYLCAGLYFSQPKRNLVNIRLIDEEFEELIRLEEYLEQENHLDLIFTLQKMFDQGAFCPCITPRKYAIEYDIRKYLIHKPGEDGDINQFKDEKNPYEEIEDVSLDRVLDRDTVDLIRTVHEEYKTLKIKRFGTISDAQEGASEINMKKFDETNTRQPKFTNYTSENLAKEIEVLLKPTAEVGETKDSLQKLLKKQAFRKLGKTKIMKALEGYQDDSEKSDPLVLNEPQAGPSKKRAAVRVPKEEWLAVIHPKNREYKRTKRENDMMKSIESTIVEVDDVAFNSTDLPTL